MDELVARHVRHGMHLHFSATMSRPNALLNAVARRFRGTRGLTVSVPAVHSNAHALALAGAVDLMITGFLGETYPTPRPCPLYRDVLAGEPFTLEAWSLLTLTQRLVAAGSGQPAAATSALLGTWLAEGKEHALAPAADPWTGEPVALLRPLRPDLTLVHGACADRRGNVVLCRPSGEGPWAAYAARLGVIASVERIVDDAVVDAHPQDVVIPGQRVLGLCEAPFGAHPQSLRTQGIGGVPGYRDDYAFLSATALACADPGTARTWFDEWIDLDGGHGAYLDRLGPDRLAALTRDDGLTRDDAPGPTRAGARVGPVRAGARTDPARVDARTDPARARTNPAPATRREALVVLGARAVARQVRERGFDTVLAGIGASHLAAWLAADLLRREGREIALVAELGFYGTRPHEGDVFLFSQRHADRSQQLSSIGEVLGGMVAANDRCLGVLAAAEIDESGDVNTSFLPDGGWLTGSGGAHDIAASCDCVVVAASGRHRYVPKVAAVTTSGRRVLTAVTEFGVFRRESGDAPFHLDSALDPGAARSLVAERTGWGCDTSGAVAEEPVRPDELAVLRALDPEGHYR
ncbi:3-oxoacid CoA-transferase [Saccharothrix xinjiangensis]